VTDNDSPIQPTASQTPETPGHPLELKPASNDAFFGPNGLRAVWRLLAFWLLYRAASFGTVFLRKEFALGTGSTFLAPRNLIVLELLSFLACLLVTWIMSRIEARRIADYGLPFRRAMDARFWLGAGVGFASISLLLVALRLAGVFHFGTLAMHGALAWRYAALYGVAFLLVGLREEFYSRGYVLFALTTGVGFWPAAILTSVWFAYLHTGNSGESRVGIISTGAIAFFFCILVRKTGDLWAAIGFHAAWDWGETFFYGVPDSGLKASGHLFSATLSGPVWLTGGSVGPEGSWFCLMLTALLCISAFCLPGVKYPNPEAIPDPRRRRVGTTQSIFPQAAKEF
jgi:hypothetical protein